MPALTTVVAIAVSCGVVFIVTTVVGTIVWVRIRQERLSLAVANARQGPYVHGLQTFPTETLTELSREEGSALRQYGQLPYGRPNEWGLLASRESLVQSTADSEASSNFMEKARGLRRSLSQSLSRSHSARRSRSFVRPRRLSSLAPLKEATERASPPPQDDDMPTSAVDGAFELPTERTPRHTPDRDEEISPSVDSSIRHMSGQWIGAHQRERSGSLFPVMEDNLQGFEQGRPRGGSITAQSAGLAPEQPVPPPPSAYPPNRFRLSKNDSIGLSSLSLETADSSILDDSRRASVGIDGDFVSPALPPCPTFAPYSANDVGRMEYDRRSFLTSSSNVPAPFIFPPNSPAREVQRVEPDRHSPRRSLTARSPSHSSGQVGPAPRRSESLSTTTTSQSRRESMYADLEQIPPLNTVTRNSALLPHFSQMQRHSIYGNPQREQDPFIASAHSVSGFIGNANAPGRRPNSFSIQETHLQTSATHPRPPLPSAMKGGSGPRKGHRRQNCVRISIHPPITFGAPAFSPMVEEPEEIDDGDRRQSEVSDLSTSNMSLLNSSVSSLSMNRTSYHELANDRPRTIEALESRSVSAYRSPTKKRKHSRNDSADSLASSVDNDKSLPELVTSLPTATESSMSRTPSPDKHPAWIVPNFAASPTVYEISPSPGSPRRSAVKGPRIQPGKPGRNSFRASPLDENASSGPTDRVPRTLSMRRESTSRPADSLQRAKTCAVDSPSSTTGRNTNVEGRSSTTSQKQQQPPGVNQATRSHGGRIVPIWEDRGSERHQSAQKPTVSLVNEPAELQGEVSASPTPKRDPSRGRQMSRPAFTTPIKKTVGLGIGAATPGSLYDGDGFLKEG